MYFHEKQTRRSCCCAVEVGQYVYEVSIKKSLVRIQRLLSVFLKLITGIFIYLYTVWYFIYMYSIFIVSELGVTYNAFSSKLWFKE